MSVYKGRGGSVLLDDLKDSFLEAGLPILGSAWDSFNYSQNSINFLTCHFDTVKRQCPVKKYIVFGPGLSVAVGMIALIMWCVSDGKLTCSWLKMGKK